MPKLKQREINVLDIALEMSDGYCLDFSNKTISIFFEEEFNIDIYDQKYSFNGSSKAKLVRAFVEVESATLVAKAFRVLWAHKETLPSYDSGESSSIKTSFFDLIKTMEGCAVNPSVRKLEKTAKLLDLDTVSRDLDRALASSLGDPESALTSACSTLESLCRSILIELSEDLPDKKDLMSLYKAVRRPLGLTPDKSQFTNEIANDVLKILKGLTTVVEGIGALRTHGGDAHGREKGYSRIDSRIANLSVHAVSSLAIFIIETWQRKFPGQNLNRH